MAIIDVPGAGVIKNRYSELEATRNKYRDRARDYAKLTLPYLLPENEQTDSSEFQNDYNTEGAKLVNALANAYTDSLFPAGRSFVKLIMETEDMTALTSQGKSQTDVEATFAMIERDFRHIFETNGSRMTFVDSLKHLIVTGNVCFYLPKDGRLSSYAIDEFVVMRSLDGTLMEIVTVDQKLVSALPVDIQSEVMTEMNLTEENLNTVVKLYTWIRRDPQKPDSWYADQAVESSPVGEQNKYTTKNLRWIPAMWNRTRREMYGRGLVEEHYGSFWTLSILSEALAAGCVTMADIKYLVRPGSLVNIQELNSSASGSYHYGEADDINEVTSNKARDLTMISQVIDSYKRHLAEVFMYLPSAMRDGERVTAEETRLRAASLEKAHGGVYSTLSETLQRPYAELLLSEMGVKGLDAAKVKLAITTGLAALSRGFENDKINHWLADLSALNQVPPNLLQGFNTQNFMKTTASGRDVDFTKILFTEQEMAQNQQAQAQGAQQGAMGEQLIKKAQPDQLAAAIQQGGQQ